MISIGSVLRFRKLAAAVAFAIGILALPVAGPRAADAPTPIVAALSLRGGGDYYGLPILDGARLAVEEANAADPSHPIDLRTADDESDTGKARDIARALCATDAVAEIGPALTISALTAGPAYAECGLPAIPATAHGDDVPKAATTFQPVFNGGTMGSSLAAYLKFVLGGTKAVILFRKDGYGQSFADGFERAGRQLGLSLVLRGFATDAERAEATAAAASDPEHPAIALGMLNADAVPILIALRRQKITSPVLAPSAIGGEQFVGQFAAEPEEASQKGFFTDHVYAASPILFDSANADVLAFADRFRRRYGREPSWPAVQGYDSARLAIEGARLAATSGAVDVAARRARVRDYLMSLDSPDKAFAGVTGPIWFTADRRREQPVRVGLFHDGLFDSAPIQLVPVATPSAQELSSGQVFEALPGHFVRRQRVVYTGIFVNEVSRVDLPRSTYNIDFYVWTRSVEEPGASFDPTDIRFSGMTGGGFNRASPADQRLMPDGTTYRLWRVDGEVRNEFDLRRFPFDRQELRLSFFNARADASRIVYVLDRGSLASGAYQSLKAPPASAGPAARNRPAQAGSVVSPDAFHQLTQWIPVSASERRENLVTDSPLGTPKDFVTERGRELSGFAVAIRLDRKALATASKSLLPLLIMTVMMFSSLYFPHGLVKEKVTVAVTAALSGAVLLTSVNAQLGSVGYTMDAEYAFYVFFGLSVLCIMTVLVAERLRGAGSKDAAVRVERWARVAYAVSVLIVIGTAGFLVART